MPGRWKSDTALVSWFHIFLAVGAVIGLPSAIVATARKHDPVGVVAILAIATFGGVVLVAGGVALMFNGYVEDAGMEPARTLHIAIPLLVVGLGISAYAWWVAARD
jgi:hypothetical protein